MAPLYKRYIPPKAPTEATVTISKPPPHPKIESPAVQETPDKKRKRERTHEEVAERKAKKLRKKGIDPATVQQDVDISVATADGDQDQSFLSVPDADAQQPVRTQPKGEFAHIKNDKKRHRLEKEARNARKAAEKAAKLAGGDTVQEKIHVDAPGDVEQEDTSVLVDQGERARKGGAVLQKSEEQEDEATEKPKRKKRWKEAIEEDADGKSVLEEPQRNNTDGAETAIDVVPQTKKRRHRLEAALAESQADGGAAQADDPEHSGKHTTVLDKFSKSVKRSKSTQQEEQFEKLPQHPVVHELELPEPDEEAAPEFRSESDTLPEWLAKPTIISSDTRATFSDLAIRGETVEMLSKLGFKDALPVQQGLIPLLLQPGMPGSKFPPGTEAVLPDVGVGAPTGSGKTIAYLLPMIEALRKTTTNGRLGALVIVPTRELVVQVAAVADSLTKGSKIRVGMATGTGKFKTEQEKLIKHGRRYDHEEYRKLMEQAKRHFWPAEDDDLGVDLNEAEEVKTEQHMQDVLDCLVEHVPTYESAIDILVATPGRLLEHVNNTLGFNLVHLKWLVIDEADKLLDNQYEGFLEALNVELTRPRRNDEQDTREVFLRRQGSWDEQRERRLRKVVLSATMTRDISKLSSLKLRLPKMVVVRGTDDDAQVSTKDDNAEVESGVKESADGFELPRTLVEYCVPVGDGSEKPLVAVELLESKIFMEQPAARNLTSGAGAEKDAEEGDDDSSSSESDESSILSSDDSSDSDSSSDESEDQQADGSEPETELPLPKRSMAPSMIQDNIQTFAPTVLVFTSSNEAASRLAHLLKGLKPQWSTRITTLIKTNPSKVRIRSKHTEPAIVISTDRASRGLDSFNDQKNAKRPVTHVIQYDVPRTLTSYIHRVGRTARAGRNGDAWTLYTHSEARWFVNEITKAVNVKRAGAVERVKVFMADEKLREQYQQVLAGMRDEVFGGGDK